MKPYYEDGSCTIYHADCREVLPGLSGVGLVLTSPPFNLSEGGHNPGRGPGCEWTGLADGYASHDDALPHAEYVDWQRDVLRKCWATLRSDGAVYYQHKPLLSRGPDRRVRLPFELIPEEMPLRQIVTWHRGSGFMRQFTHYVPTFEWLLLLTKPDFRITTRDVFDVWRIPPEAGSEHPAPFPLKLATQAVGTTTAGLVVDPFAGSGTTLRAAKDLGRRAIGIEIEERYCEIAATRLAQEVLDFGSDTVRNAGEA